MDNNQDQDKDDTMMEVNFEEEDRLGLGIGMKECIKYRREVPVVVTVQNSNYKDLIHPNDIFVTVGGIDVTGYNSEQLTNLIVSNTERPLMVRFDTYLPGDLKAKIRDLWSSLPSNNN